MIYKCYKCKSRKKDTNPKTLPKHISESKTQMTNILPSKTVFCLVAELPDIRYTYHCNIVGYFGCNKTYTYCIAPGQSCRLGH